MTRHTHVQTCNKAAAAAGADTAAVVQRPGTSKCSSSSSDCHLGGKAEEHHGCMYMGQAGKGGRFIYQCIYVLRATKEPLTR